MIRLMYGLTAMIRVNAGSTTTFGTSHACSPGGMIDTAGNHRNTYLVASSRIRVIPITKSGSAARQSVPVDRTWSVGLSRLTAIHTPSEIESGIATIAEIATRNAEFASGPEISLLTGSWVGAEIPRLPVRIPLSQCQYCANADSLRCNWSVSAFNRAGVA